MVAAQKMTIKQLFAYCSEKFFLNSKDFEYAFDLDASANSSQAHYIKVLLQWWAVLHTVITEFFESM